MPCAINCLGVGEPDCDELEKVANLSVSRGAHIQSKICGDRYGLHTSKSTLHKELSSLLSSDRQEGSPSSALRDS